MSQREVKIVNEDGEEGFALESALPAWERRGWTRADDGSSEPEAEPAEEKPAKKTTSRKAD
jgi:hypothetical protein